MKAPGERTPQSAEARRHSRMGSGLYAHVVETLGQEIVDGRLAVGELIYAESLSERFGISRSVVRESVRTLSSMGLLEARPQVGTRVLAIENWDLLNPQIIAWRGRGRHAATQQRELLEVRLGVEPVAARLAAERMSDDAAQALLAAALQMRTAQETDDGTLFFDADALFHRLLLEGAGNRVMEQFAGTIGAVLHSRTHLAETRLVKAAVDLHVDLAQALVDRDADRADRLSTQLVAQTLDELAGQGA